MNTLASGLSLATTAAIVAVAAAQTAPVFAKSHDDGKQIHCYGINSCKGTSDCKTAKNECKGQNDCKGQGFKTLTAKACAAAGGSTSEAE